MISPEQYLLRQLKEKLAPAHASLEAQTQCNENTDNTSETICLHSNLKTETQCNENTDNNSEMICLHSNLKNKVDLCDH